MTQTRGAADRLRRLGDELVAIHDRLRGDLRQVRQQIEDGTAPAHSGSSLSVHCLAFCSALTRHHTGEDAGAFPQIADQFPELAPVITKLEQDHAMMSGLIADLERVVSALADDPSLQERTRLLSHLDGLTAICDSHFAFEERSIREALNELQGEHLPEDLFGQL
ncbi:Hemerythrin HHE cation binding domain-containing protein [Amycolatopsis marina]|uniref:Hemerythrin HHE cation binding domain-containing protein n=1 Tax=Amycolatopsis marina TaxID=490629 RepID=A0A1I0VPH1_9PSEU|nr:hemerythrin domain-containing protein [Amycolatopsis marina]SFA78242.1 Hemerythrin HHE cation binding domain-containing protein [Amycolatopsis marina]